MTTMPDQSIHPRLLPTAEARLARLRSRLRAEVSNTAERLENIVVKMRALIAQHKIAEAGAILSEYQFALAEVRNIAGPEGFNAAGILAVQRRLTAAGNDLDGLRDRVARKAS